MQYAGTIMQMEASGAATGEELRSGRAQHTFLVPPLDVREAADGAFWIIQAGGIAPFRALPTRRVAAPAPAAAAEAEVPSAVVTEDVDGEQQQPRDEEQQEHAQ